MSIDEKLTVIEPMLDNLKNLLLNVNTTDCVIATYADDKPEIRNGAWELVSVPYLTTDTIEIKVTRVKST